MLKRIPDILLNITKEIIDDIAIIKCSGIIQKSHEMALSVHMKECLKKEAKGILFDWSDVHYFDSMGLESLIRLYKISVSHPGTFISVLITDSILTDIYITLRFDRIVPLFACKSDALAGLRMQIEESVSSAIE